MTALPESASKFQQVLLTGARENWCVKRNCTTCGCSEMRALLGEGTIHSRQDVSLKRATAIALDLAAIDREDIRVEFGRAGEYWVQEAMMWLIYGIWRHLGDTAHDEVFPLLEGTWAGDVYQIMQAHYRRVRGV